MLYVIYRILWHWSTLPFDWQQDKLSTSLTNKIITTNTLPTLTHAILPINYAISRALSTTTTTKLIWIILCMRPTNERRRYIVTLSLIRWAHTQNDPWGLCVDMVFVQ